MPLTYKIMGTALAVALILQNAPAQRMEVLPVHEVSLGKISPAMVKYSLVESLDGRHLAYVVKHANGMAVVVDGHEGATYPEIPGYTLNESGRPPEIKFSADGAHYAYVARVGQKSFLVVDGVKSKEYEAIDPSKFVFSPNGKRIAFIVKQAEKEIVVVDGVEGVPFDYIQVTLPKFSADSQHITYSGRRDNHDVLVLDGKEIASAEQVRPIEFSPDGKHWAYVVHENQKATAVIDGSPGKSYDNIGNTVVFSDDSQHVLYRAETHDGFFIVADGVEQKTYSFILEGEYGFSPNNAPEYIAQFSRNDRMLVEGLQESSHYDFVINPLSRQRSLTGAHRIFIASRSGKFMVVRDGKEDESFDDIERLTVSPDGEKLIYNGIRKNKRYLVDNGTVIALPDGVAISTFAHSVEANHYAYCVQHDGAWHVVLDGKESAGYSMMPSSLHFTPAGRLIYVAENSGKQFVVIHGTKGREYDKIGDIFSWNSEESIAYEAYRGNKIVIVFGNKESAPYDELYRRVPGDEESVPRFIGKRGGEYWAVTPVVH